MHETSFKSAINNTIELIQNISKTEKIDMDLLVNNCIKEFNNLDLPFYSIKVDEKNENHIIIEVPFLKECHIEVNKIKEGSAKKRLILFINKKPIRQIALEGYEPEYIKKVVHFALDYLKKFIVLKNKFLS